MSTFRIPVLLWQDHEGFFTAVPLEQDLAGEEAAAVGATAAKALDGLKDCLDWQAKQGAWIESDFHDPELIHVAVSVRPQYRSHDRVYPCNETVKLRIPCVHGRRQDGLLVCSLPTLGVDFYLHGRESVRQMVTERIRQQLEGKTPGELARLLPPAEVRLERVSVLQPRRSRRAEADEPPTLSRVAQAVGAPQFRKRFSAPYQREAELVDLIRRLGKEKANVVLVGEHGTGKTALLVAAVRNLERQAASEDDDEPAAGRRRYWLTTAARLIAGMKYLGQWEERCEEVIRELSQIDGVLCAESLIELARLGGTGPGDSIASFFLPYLENGELRLVAEATPAELDACRRLLPGLVEVFQVLRVADMDVPKARAVLGEMSQVRSRDLKIEVEEQVPAEVCRLHRRFMPYQAMPGRPAEFLNRLFDRAQEERLGAITPGDVTRQFIGQTGLPELLVRDDRPLCADDVVAELRRRIIGQNRACRTLAELIATFKAGLADPQRPIGTLLFCGPTGVGKTELAKAASQYLFGGGTDTDRLVRLDMSEYSAPWNAQRLIAKEDGTPSDFLARVRQQPFVVVLLDEIEKAASEAFDVLLGLLDEGRLTDRFGRTTNFRSAIVVMTSNLGTSSGRSIGFSSEVPDRYEAEVQAFFRPEFFNRLDAVVMFRPLDPDTCLAIVRKELDEIAGREGFTKADLRLTYTDRLVQHLVQEGFDARYGARPLQRVLERRVVSAISRHLVAHPALRKTHLHLDLNPQHRVVVTASDKFLPARPIIRQGGSV